MDILETKSFAKEIEKMSFLKFIPRTLKAFGASAKTTLPLLGLGGIGAVAYGAAKIPKSIEPETGIEGRYSNFYG